MNNELSGFLLINHRYPTSLFFKDLHEETVRVVLVREGARRPRFRPQGIRHRVCDHMPTRS